MSTPVKAIPDGYHAITPYLVLSNANEAISFYIRAFGAVERMRLEGPPGKVGHAELVIGDSVIMLADECPEADWKSPETLGGTSIGIHMYVEDVDARIAQAIAAGASPLRPVKEQFYGDRSGSVKDPYGYIWHLATHVEDVSPEEIGRRAEAMIKAMASAQA